MASFEIVSKYADQGINLPIRKTAHSAGYDFEAAEDILLPPYRDELMELLYYSIEKEGVEEPPYTLEEVEKITKQTKAKPTLVPTGIKAKLDEGTYLELSVRSSLPLKHWILMGNSVGIIDGDYYNNPSNEGHIFFQLINFSPFPIIIKKGEAIGQGIIKSYLKTENDNACGERKGGFGSTTKR